MTVETSLYQAFLEKLSDLNGSQTLGVWRTWGSPRYNEKGTGRPQKEQQVTGSSRNPRSEEFIAEGETGQGTGKRSATPLGNE